MELVIDANILFAALIKRNLTSNLIFREGLRFYAPEFLLVEFMKYRPLLKRKTERSDADFDRLIDVLRRRIIIVPAEEIELFVVKAKKISPDPKDAAYIALAMKLNIPIWSNDRKLKAGQKLISVYSTEDLLDLL